MKKTHVRVPSPRTAGMMTQHKNSLLKLLRGILNRCAHHPINAVDLFKKNVTKVWNKRMWASLRRALPVMKQKRGNGRISFTLPADRLSKYCLFTKIATRHYRNICVEQHFSLPSHELSLELVAFFNNTTLRSSTQPTGMYVTSLSPVRYVSTLI